MSDAHSSGDHAPTPRTTTVWARGGRVSFAAPADWDTFELSPTGGDVAAVEPGKADRFRTNVVLTFADVDGSLDDWERTTRRREQRELVDCLQLDQERVLLADRVWARRLTSHATPASESVTTESWMTVVDGRGVTLTARVATLRLAEMSPVIDAIAASLVVRADGLVPA